MRWLVSCCQKIEVGKIMANKIKLSIFISLILLFVMIIALDGCHKFSVAKSGISQYSIDDDTFNSNKKHFETVCHRLWECYGDESKKNEIEYIRVNLQSDLWELTCITDEGEEYTVNVTPSEKEGKASSKVREAFMTVGVDNYHGLSSVVVTTKQISFIGNECPYAVIRVKGFFSRPSFLLKPDEDRKTFCNRLSWYWYEGVETDK